MKIVQLEVSILFTKKKKHRQFINGKNSESPTHAALSWSKLLCCLL